MVDLGFGDLRVVNDYGVPFDEARSAIDAGPVMQAARQFASLADSVADCTLVLGTTAMGVRRLQHPVALLRDAAVQAMAERAAGGRVALVFGSEKTGLSNEEMSLCHALLTIPMASTSVSMNLGQAVAVCLYEMARDAQAPRALPEAAAAATQAELTRLEDTLREVLFQTRYDGRYPGNMGHESLHRLVRRLHMQSADVTVWLGMLRQILWRLRGLQGAETEHES